MGIGKGVPDLARILNPPQTRGALSSAVTRLNSRQAPARGMLCKGVRVSPSVQESDGDEGVDEGEEEEQQEHEYDDRSTPPSPAGDSDVMLSSTWAPNTDATDAGNGFIMLQARILLGHLSLASVNEENLVRDTSHSCQRFRSNIWDEVAKLTAKTRDR